jgi:hypothetical protein
LIIKEQGFSHLENGNSKKINPKVKGNTYAEEYAPNIK